MNNIQFLYDVLMSDDPQREVEENLSKLLTIIPELRWEIGFEHRHPHHHLDVWNHTLYALSLSEKDFDVRFALLLHDIGKPFSYTEQDGIRHFYNHHEVSAKMAKVIMQRLGFDEYATKKLTYLIANHDIPISLKDIDNYPHLTQKRYEIQRCDALAHHPDKLVKRKKYLEEIKEKIKAKNDK